MHRDASIKLDNYSGFWCVEPVRFTQMVDRINSMNLTAHIEAQEPVAYDSTAQHFETVESGSIAVIDINGTMTKAGSSLGGGGTVEARHAIRQAERAASVEWILLRFDTPGGTVAGTADLAAEVAKTTKPTVAFIEDLCASAGMWVASQCDEVYANTQTAQVGSIGTFMAVYDVSAALEEEHIRTIVVKAGEFKGGGFPGMEISDEQIAEWQKVINATQEQFTNAIASGRGMSQPQAQQLVTGLVYIAGDAKALNLIDDVKSFDEVIRGMRVESTHQGERSMSKESTTPTAATYKELVAACPGIDPQAADDAIFLSECQDAALTTSDATALYCDALRDRLKVSTAANTKLCEQVETLKTELAEATRSRRGVRAVGTTGKADSSSDPSADFKAAVREQQKNGKSRAEAVRAVNREQPELREALVASSN